MKKYSNIFLIVMGYYFDINGSAMSMQVKDFKMDIEKVLATEKPEYSTATLQDFYGRLFVDRKIYPVKKYFYNEMCPALYHLDKISIAKPMSEVISSVAGDNVERTQEWLQDHHVSHSHFDSCNLVSSPYVAEKGEPGYVYFILDRDKNQMKIGHSSDPEKRLNNLRTGCPDAQIVLKLWVVDMRAEEDYYHKLFSQSRRGATEWFFMGTEIERFIENHKKGKYSGKTK